MQMYQDNPLFTAANTNKHLLLKIIPLSLWQETEHINSYPFHAYRLNEDRSQPLTVEGYNFGNLMDIANSQKIYLFGKLLEPENAVLPLKVTMFEEQYLEEPTIHDNYVSFWERYDDVVIIDLGNSDKDTGIIASLYAAFLNAPLFLIDLDNIDTIPDYSLIYTDKNAYVIGDIGSNTNQYINDIKSNVNSFRHYTKAYISKIEVNPYAKLYSRIQPVTTVT